MKHIAIAIVIVGFTGASAYQYAHGVAGDGWGVLAFLTLFFWEWDDK